jgi:hypothetical protein
MMTIAAMERRLEAALRGSEGMPLSSGLQEAGRTQARQQQQGHGDWVAAGQQSI